MIWRRWDVPSRFLFGGVLFACMLAGWHIVARLME